VHEHDGVRLVLRGGHAPFRGEVRPAVCGRSSGAAAMVPARAKRSSLAFVVFPVV
jgi:hypothetical protein